MDLPMPGSPPIKMTDPATNPPPNTRSNSPMPVSARPSASVSISWIGDGSSLLPRLSSPRGCDTRSCLSSTKLFH